MRSKLFYGFSYIDVINKKVIENYYIKVCNGIIVEMDSAQQLSEAEKNTGVNMGSQLLCPGLFNIHTHVLSTPIAAPASLNTEEPAKFALRGYKHLLQYLESGVTFVRDLNGRKQAEIELRNAIREGILIGPHYQVCRQCLVMTGGHGSNTGFECDGEAECAKAARTQIKYGADFIKIMATGGIMSEASEKNSELSEAEMRAAIQVAHLAGKKTATHAHGSQGILNAVKAGIDSVEHGTYLTDEIIELMKEKGTALVPTLTVSANLLSADRLDGVASFQIEKSKRAHEAHIRSFCKAWEAGILIGLGTDAGTPLNPHTDTWKEFNEMVKLGCDPLDVMRVGTIQSAKIVGMDKELGSLEVGKRADFIVLKENPAVNINTLKNPVATYLGGQRFIAPALEW